MGGSHSSAISDDPHYQHHEMKRSEADLVRLMLPIYYTSDPVTNEDLEVAKSVWNMILDDTGPKYLQLKSMNAELYSSCVMMFYDNFYQRLFDVHPVRP